MRRKDREIAAEEAWEVANSCSHALLSMVDEAGEPYAVPVNVAGEGGCFYFHTAMEGKKIDCLRKHPRVCMNFLAFAEVDAPAFTTRYASAIAFGNAEEITDEEERTQALRAICRKLAPHEPRTEGDFAECRGKTMLWKVTVTEITGKRNSK